jgi:filamentous hemagglutinin
MSPSGSRHTIIALSLPAASGWCFFGSAFSTFMILFQHLCSSPAGWISPSAAQIPKLPLATVKRGNFGPRALAEGTLEEGSAAHVALHAIVGCAGAAASSQSCASGAAGAAACSLLTRLFSDPSPNETNAERETKRNLIAIIVTGIASMQDSGASTATNAAIAAVDNNWLATQQIVQMKKELAQAKTVAEKLMVQGKWAVISGKQDVLTSSGVGMGLAEAGWNDVKGLAEFLSDPVTGLKGLKDIITKDRKSVV